MFCPFLLVFGVGWGRRRKVMRRKINRFQPNEKSISCNWLWIFHNSYWGMPHKYVCFLKRIFQMRLFPSFFSLRVGRKTAILSVYVCGVWRGEGVVCAAELRDGGPLSLFPRRQDAARQFLAQKQALGLELHSPFAIFAYGKNRSKERRRLCLHIRS